MDFWRALLMLSLCGSLLRSAGTTGLQVYYFRQPFTPYPNPIQPWKVEGLATWIMQNAFSDNLDCNTTSNNGTGVSWRRTQATLNPNWIQTVANGRRLVLDSFTNSNLGIYTCYDNVTNETVTINITSANPAIQAVSDVVNIEAGSSGQLKVYVSGIPDPSSTAITWFKLGPGGTMTELREPTVNFSSDHRTLLLTNVQDSDGGTYMCIVTQNIPQYPSANVFITLAITRNNASALVISQQPSNQSVIQSANITLSCSATGLLAPAITWMRTSGWSLPPSSTAVVTYGNSTTTTSTLSIADIQPQDGGQYWCQAIANSTSSVRSRPAYVQVQPQATLQSPATATVTGTTVASTSNVPISNCDLSQGCTAAPLPVVIIGVGAGGGAIVALVAVAVLLYVCIYFRYSKPLAGTATWPETSPRSKSSTNVLFHVQDGGHTGNGEVIIQHHTSLVQTPSTTDTEIRYSPSRVPTSSPSHVPGKDPIYSPLVVPKEPMASHEYSGIIGANALNPSSYNRLQRDSLKRNNSSNTADEGSVQLQANNRPGEVTLEKNRNVLSEDNGRRTLDGNGDDGNSGSIVAIGNGSTSAVYHSPQPSNTAEKIPMRRYGSDTPATIPEGPATLYTSTISALSSAPASNLSITSPSNVFVGSLPEKPPLTNRDKNGCSALPSVPEYAVLLPPPAYENVVLPPPAVRRHPVPSLDSATNCAVASECAVDLTPTIAEQPWYEVEEADSDVSFPVHHGVAHQVQVLPSSNPRAVAPSRANFAMQNGTNRVIAYQGSLSRATPRAEPRREAFFSSSLSCGTTV